MKLAWCETKFDSLTLIHLRVLDPLLISKVIPSYAAAYNLKSPTTV